MHKIMIVSFVLMLSGCASSPYNTRLSPPEPLVPNSDIQLIRMRTFGNVKEYTLSNGDAINAYQLK